MDKLLLAIDTSTSYAGIALLRSGRLLAEESWEVGRNHTIQLLPALSSLLAQNRVSIADIGAIAVAKGPGSFNGLRAGMATAKGLAYSLDAPLVGVSTLEVEAYQHAAADIPICPLHDAGRKELAAALFRGGESRWERLMEEQIIKVEDLVAKLEGRVLFCGEAPDWAVPLIRQSMDDRAVLAAGVASIRRPGVLGELAWRRLCAGEQDDLMTLQPMYLRRPPVGE